MPDSCLPQKQLTTWQSLKGWFMWQLSWSHDPCEQYHRALLVDPFWEVTPMMVNIFLKGYYNNKYQIPNTSPFLHEKRVHIVFKLIKLP